MIMKKLCGAIKKTLTPTEKRKTDGKLNYETVMTKAVMTEPQMENEKKKMNLIKGKNCLKKGNEGGEKTKSSNKKFVVVKKEGCSENRQQRRLF